MSQNSTLDNNSQLDKPTAAALGFPTQISKGQTAQGLSSFNDLSAQEVKAMLGNHTLIMQHLIPQGAPQGQQDQAQGSQTPNSAPQQTKSQESNKQAPKQEQPQQTQDLKNLVETAVNEAISGIRNDIKQLLADEQSEKQQETNEPNEPAAENQTQ